MHPCQSVCIRSPSRRLRGPSCLRDFVFSSLSFQQWNPNRMTLSLVLQILSILIPLIHLTGIGFAIHATLFSRTSQGSIAWALSLVFFPYISVPLYLVF